VFVWVVAATSVRPRHRFVILATCDTRAAAFVGITTRDRGLWMGERNGSWSAEVGTG